MIYCYFGHHKCASTWITNIVFDICAINGFRPYQKQINLIEDLENEISPNKVDFYICQTSIYEKVSKIKNYKGFHVIRDPRDIIISAYFSHLYSHSTEGWKPCDEAWPSGSASRTSTAVRSARRVSSSACLPRPFVRSSTIAA